MTMTKDDLHSKSGRKDRKSAMLLEPFMSKVGWVHVLKNKQLEQVRTIEKISFLLHHMVFKLGLHSRPNVSSWNPEPQAKVVSCPTRLSSSWWWRPQIADFEKCSIWELLHLRIAPFEKCSIWELLHLRIVEFEKCWIWELSGQT